MVAFSGTLCIVSANVVVHLLLCGYESFPSGWAVSTFVQEEGALLHGLVLLLVSLLSRHNVSH